MYTIGLRHALYPFLVTLCLACTNNPSESGTGDDPGNAAAELPRGLNTALVIKSEDGCGLHAPEFDEGRSLSLLLDVGAAGVTVSVPGSTLPRLASNGRTLDRFRTVSRQVPISAQEGRCTAQRTQYYEGFAVPPAAYHVVFHNLDELPMGACGGTPLPCATTVTLSLRFCPSPTGCGPADLGG